MVFKKQLKKPKTNLKTDASLSLQRKKYAAGNMML